MSLIKKKEDKKKEPKGTKMATDKLTSMLLYESLNNRLMREGEAELWEGPVSGL